MPGQHAQRSRMQAHLPSLLLRAPSTHPAAIRPPSSDLVQMQGCTCSKASSLSSMPLKRSMSSTPTNTVCPSNCAPSHSQHVCVHCLHVCQMFKDLPGLLGHCLHCPIPSPSVLLLQQVLVCPSACVNSHLWWRPVLAQKFLPCENMLMA